LRAEGQSGEPLSILLAVIYLVPVVCVAVMQPEFFSPRYFLVILPFLYVGIAMLAARLARTGAGRLGMAIVLALFLAGQARLYFKFLQVGRGQFTAAIEYMIMHTPSQKVVVASNQGFRSSIELAYFAPRVLKTQQQLFYVDDRASLQPEWYILHQEGSDSPGPATLSLAGQPMWYRAAYFGASELSGQAWTIYSHQLNP
jgi:hypothetical protein